MNLFVCSCVEVLCLAELVFASRFPAMRQKRAKTYKKLMELYSRSFGFRQPYQVLVDSSFCVYATQNKIDIPKQLGAVLQGQQKQSSFGPQLSLWKRSLMLVKCSDHTMLYG